MPTPAQKVWQVNQKAEHPCCKAQQDRVPFGEDFFIQMLMTYLDVSLSIVKLIKYIR